MVSQFWPAFAVCVATAVVIGATIKPVSIGHLGKIGVSWADGTHSLSVKVDDKDGALCCPPIDQAEQRCEQACKANKDLSGTDLRLPATRCQDLRRESYHPSWLTI